MRETQSALSTPPPCRQPWTESSPLTNSRPERNILAMLAVAGETGLPEGILRRRLRLPVIPRSLLLSLHDRGLIEQLCADSDVWRLANRAAWRLGQATEPANG